MDSILSIKSIFLLSYRMSGLIFIESKTFLKASRKPLKKNNTAKACSGCHPIIIPIMKTSYSFETSPCHYYAYKSYYRGNY